VPEANLPQRGVIAREEFAATELSIVPETAAAAVAAREKATVEARFVVAMKRPRDMETVRVRLLKECSRPGMAKIPGGARWRRPVGREKVAGKWVDIIKEGPSIRFVEVALRCFGNVHPESCIVFEDEGQRIVRITVTDLENNLTYSTEILIKKVVERKNPREGQEVISSRLNSAGAKTYLVEASEDEIQNKTNLLISKALRNSGLRLIPGDIVDECMEKVKEVERAADKDDPDAAKRKVIDAFATIGIEPADLQMYLEHGLERMQPAELSELRGIWTAINDGETTWDAVMEAKAPTGSIEAAEKIAEEKIARAKMAQQGSPEPAVEATTVTDPPTEEQMREWTSAEELREQEEFPKLQTPKPVFGRKK